MKKIFFLLLIVAAGLAVYYSYQILTPGSNEATSFKIAKGQSTAAIAADLKDAGLIKSILAFKIYAKLAKAENKFVAGEHQLPADASIKEIVGVLISSKATNEEITLTFIEGWKIDDMAQYLNGKGLTKSDQFEAAVQTAKWRQQYDYLSDIKAKNLEGFLFPDTYRVFANAKAEDIVKKMLDNFNLKLTDQMRSDIKKQGKNLFDVVTLASIVEREGRLAQDRRIIADIFLKRLDKGIGLQSDATINYITGKKDLRPNSNDLEIDSPYNTYKYRGLPPGPICNPGLEAINAVIYPEKNDYYYFLTDKDGKAIFAKTYEEHLLNIKKYLD